MSDNTPTYNRLLSVLKLSILLLLFACVGSACSGREAFSEESEAQAEGEEVIEEEPYDGKLLAQVVFDSIDYIAPRQELLQPFIREFGDGTVVDKVMINKVQESKEDEPAYYLVGLGILNGAFKSMALELDVSSDNSLYLSSKGEKHICEAAIDCNFCYFTFSGNKIIGCECSSREAGTNCRHTVSQTNNLLQGVELRNTRKD
ncbi:hypothetical protein ACFSKU_19435 [Pontibacter silvestris]|uniref:SWIM-type domain-containing protein n=1 Tax=Pontibacter silvestris TaxID=2305183 RepID=A0ABW4X272_9BACT|nr:hypothetical protein [Pontibacter silvestris]MCC9134938.1 hypothetical protein [Pontibacter silvestris]